MDNRRTSASLQAAARVREIAVDDAKRALADATDVRDANLQAVTQLKARFVEAEAGEGALLGTDRLIDLASLERARGYRRWLTQELVSAERRLADGTRLETEARAALTECLRARDAVKRVQERRRVEETSVNQRRAEHLLDEQAALRLMTAQRDFISFLSGEQHGS